eukprot:Gb_10047 [translate_table: standard]
MCVSTFPLWIDRSFEFVQSMATRATFGRLGLGRTSLVNRMAWRSFSEGKGRVLGEEEKAAENVYIKKMEKERLEKLKQKMEKEKQAGGEARKDEPSS